MMQALQLLWLTKGTSHRVKNIKNQGNQIWYPKFCCMKQSQSCDITQLTWAHVMVNNQRPDKCQDKQSPYACMLLCISLRQETGNLFGVALNRSNSDESHIGDHLLVCMMLDIQIIGRFLSVVLLEGLCNICRSIII